MAEEAIQNNQDLDKTSDVKKERKGIILKIVIIPLALVIQAAAAYFVVFNFINLEFRVSRGRAKEKTRKIA